MLMGFRPDVQIHTSLAGSLDPINVSSAHKGYAAFGIYRNSLKATRRLLNQSPQGLVGCLHSDVILSAPQSGFNTLVAEWFQNVIQGVHLEGLGSVFIMGRHKNHRRRGRS